MPKTQKRETAAEFAKALRRRSQVKKAVRPKPQKDRPYRPAVVTLLLDILGFREQVAGSQGAAKIRRIPSRLRSFSDVGEPDDKWEEAHSHEVARSIAFSDSIVRIRFFDTEYPSGVLFHEILSLLQVQGEMMADDVLVRGGITIGPVYLEGDMAFGPAFNRAYDPESQFASVPPDPGRT